MCANRNRWKAAPFSCDEILIPRVIVGWDLSRLDQLKFHSDKPGSSNHYFNHEN